MKFLLHHLKHIVQETPSLAKVWTLNVITFGAAVSEIEDFLKVLLLAASLIYTVIKIIKELTKNGKGKESRQEPE